MNATGIYGLEITPDGSSVAIIAATTNEPPVIILFKNANTTNYKPFFYTFKAFKSLFRFNLALSNDGNLVSGTIDTTIFMLNHTKNQLSFQKYLDFETNDYCMSSDGVYVAYVFTNTEVWGYNGNVYVPSYNISSYGEGFIGGNCYFTDDYKLILSYYSIKYNHNRVNVYQFGEVGTEPTMLWDYYYPFDQGTYQDITSQISAAGDYFAVSSWGDGLTNSPPQLNVFSLSNGNSTALTFNTQVGSMNGVDVQVLENGVTIVVVAGKNVHSNIMGSGGLIYTFQMS